MPAALITHPTIPNALYNGPGGVAAGGGGFVEVARFTASRTETVVVIQGKVTVAALTDLKLARAAVTGGEEVDLVSGADWATLAAAGGSVVVRAVAPAAPNTTAAGASFQIEVGCRFGGDLVLYAKSAGAAVVAVVASAR